MKKIFLSIIILCIGAPVLSAKPQVPEVSLEVRGLAIQAIMEGHSNYISVYTKGLVCSSCGIGLRIHLKKLKGVNKEQFREGVELDVRRQLITVAFKVDAEIDPKAVQQAIYNAGYDPVDYYLWSVQDGVTKHQYIPLSE